MNGLLGQLKEITDIDRIAAAYPAVETGICPPATMIYPASQAVPSIFIGAQDCHLSVSGAHTGCLSAEMLKEAGARTIIAGHSDRRIDQHERHQDVAAQASEAHGQGLNVILCVGDRELQRDASDNVGEFAD